MCHKAYYAPWQDLEPLKLPTCLYLITGLPYNTFTHSSTNCSYLVQGYLYYATVQLHHVCIVCNKLLTAPVPVIIHTEYSLRTSSLGAWIKEAMLLLYYHRWFLTSLSILDNNTLTITISALLGWQIHPYRMWSIIICHGMTCFYHIAKSVHGNFQILMISLLFCNICCP